MGILTPFAPYRDVLVLPRVRSLIAITSLARVPAAAASVR